MAVATTADLFLAVVRRDAKAVEKIIRSGADPDHLIAGATPLSLSVYRGNAETVRALIQAGASVNQRSQDHLGRIEPPLCSACRLGHFDICQMLLECPSIDPDRIDFFGKTPLWIAAKERRYDLVQLLIRCGADVNAFKCWSDCPLYLCAKYGGRIRIAEALVVRGCHLDYEDSRGRSPLYWAVEKEDREMFELLVNAGAQIRPRWRLHPSRLPSDWRKDENFYSWIENLRTRPLPLTQIVRTIIRKRLSLVWKGLDESLFIKLPLPPFMIEFLLYRNKDN
ncbi:ankyrin repeat and SOCS box protein 13-like [Centruroides vittatus]|uniref:ankyrin repeat and SOCS box protein 13-like n=1 Tax=Centruroides vittatus TaxID=120091 RepID=UPI00350FEEB9